MKIDVRRMKMLFSKYGLKWGDIAYVLDTTISIAKKELRAREIYLEEDEAERLLRCLSVSEVLSIMPRREGVMAIARM